MGYTATYERFNALHSDLKIEIKRVNSLGVYEAQWVDLEKLIANEIVVQSSIPTMSYKLPNESFSYGVLRVPDCTLKLLSINGEFSSQENEESIFKDFIRHKSLVRISHGYKDHNTDLFDYIEVYQGFINEKSSKTKVSNDNTYQDLFIEDLLTFLMKEYTRSDFADVTAPVLNDMLFELFNRPEFTDFLEVDIENIKAGYDVQNVDFTNIEGQTQWLTIVQDLSIGHSYLYQKKGVLYYQSINDRRFNTNVDSTFEDYLFQDGEEFLFQDGEKFLFNKKIPINFGVDKIIKFTGFGDGVDEVFERLYWEDTAISFISPTNTYNKTKTFNIESITDADDRANVLATTGTRTSRLKPKFKLKVALFVDLSILEAIEITAGDYLEDGGLVWDLGSWDEENWGGTLGASFAENGTSWVIKEIKHNFQALTTELLVESI